MYEAELRKRNAEKKEMEDGKTDIGWDIKSALTFWINRASRICAPMWK